MLRAQSAAGRSFNFRERFEIFVPDQFQQYRLTQPGCSDQAHRSIPHDVSN
jgi:hypothetical protein